MGHKCHCEGALRNDSLRRGAVQLAKLEFVGMPPRAMRDFARVVIFPSFGRAQFFLACAVQYVIASQCAQESWYDCHRQSLILQIRCAEHHWRGNPHPLTHSNDENAKRRTDCHTSDIGHWFAMTALSWCGATRQIGIWRTQRPPCVKGAVSEADWGIDNPSGKNQ